MRGSCRLVDFHSVRDWSAWLAQLKEEAGGRALRRENEAPATGFFHAHGLVRHKSIGRLGLAAAAFGLCRLGVSFGLFGGSALRFGLFARRSAVGAFRGGRCLAIRLADAVNFANSDSQESAKTSDTVVSSPAEASKAFARQCAIVLIATVEGERFAILICFP